MSSISQKVLTEQLKELIADDIVRREETGPAPAPVIYSLTDYGRSLIPLIEKTTVQASRAHWLERLDAA